MSDADHQRLIRRIGEGRQEDEGRWVVRLDPGDLAELGVDIGDPVRVGDGEDGHWFRALPTHSEERGQGQVQMTPKARRAVGKPVGEDVTVSGGRGLPLARVVEMVREGGAGEEERPSWIAGAVDGWVVQGSTRRRVSDLQGRDVTLRIEGVEPGPVAVIGEGTEIRLRPPKAVGDAPVDRRPKGAYEHIGGMGEQIARVREVLEWPLRAPEVFRELGIDAPRGVLMHGPPGCGKTLLARAIAEASGASFFSISGPEVIQKYYGESEARLREIFEQAMAQAPSIIFIDEVDTLAPRRSDAGGDVERRVVATLLTLLDGMKKRGQVVVLGATNRPNAIDPALRRPGRFDREIPIPIPDQEGRRQILAVHSRRMPLAEDVDLHRLAERTHGYVGADLEALCRESAIACLRRQSGSSGGLEGVAVGRLLVERRDFEAALAEIKPSAIREVFVEHPTASWDDIGGYRQVRQRLVESLQWPLKYGHLFDAAHLRAPRGVLLHGPPGCGKTLLARAAASEIEVNFINVKGPELFDKYVGATERRIREIFDTARRAAPSMIFFDEIDALAPRRGAGASEDQVGERLLGQLLTELDGLEDRGRVFVLGATNRVDRLDEALLRPGRFDQVIELPLPNRRQRQEILAVHLRDVPEADGVEREQLADRMEGFSGAQIAEVCRRATLEALREVIDGQGEAAATIDLRVEQKELKAAIDDVKLEHL